MLTRSEEYRGPEAPVETQAAVPAHSWYALAVLSLISFFAYTDRIALSILLEPIKADLKLHDWELGVLSGLAFALFYSTLGFPLARLADRSSRLKLLSACLALWSVMTAISGLSRNFLHLFVARIGVGVGEAGCVPAAHSLISDYFPRNRRALAISIFQIGGSAGLGVGMFVVGLLGEKLGWRTSLQLVGIAGIPLALLVLLTMREPPRPPIVSAGKEPARAAFGALLRRPAFVHLVIGYAVSSIASYGISAWFPSFMIRSFNMSMAEVGAWTGLATSLSGMSGLLVGGIAATYLAPRDPRWELWIPAIAYAFAFPLYVIVFMSPSAWVALVLKVFANFMTGVGGGVAMAAAQSFAEPNRRATAVSILIFLSALLGLGGGPFLIGGISDLLEPSQGIESLRYALMCVCVMLVWAVVHFALSARHSVRDRVN